MYLCLLENEGDLKCNVTASQWCIVGDLHNLLKPFMIAQRLLEGQSYVTICLVPYIIYKTSYISETVNRVNDVDRENPVVNVVSTADAELTLYKQVPQLSCREMTEH